MWILAALLVGGVSIRYLWGNSNRETTAEANRKLRRQRVHQRERMRASLRRSGRTYLDAASESMPKDAADSHVNQIRSI